MTDVVYVLGTGSNWEDNELRFSLRSLETYLENMGTVYVVGERPRWLTGVVHLPFKDKTTCKERNIMLKVAYACGHPDLSENFLHVHDDHFALAPARAGEIPNWYGGTLEKMYNGTKPEKRNHWHLAVRNTWKILESRGLPGLNYDIHYPMLFNKNLYPGVMDVYPWTTEPRGFVVKSLYANTVGLTGTPIGDIKLMDRLSNEGVVAQLKGRPWFSIGNAGLSNSFKSLLRAIYPTPSRFESE